MAAINNLQSAVSLIHLVHSRENRQMFDVLDVSVRIGVDVRVETSCRRISRLRLPGVHVTVESTYHFLPACS